MPQGSPINVSSIHSYVWLPSWTTELGEKAARQAAAAGYGHIVIPLRDHSVIDPAAIVRLCQAAGVTPVTTANQLPDADISSTEREVWRRGIERHRASFALARDLGAAHVGGIIYGVFGKAKQAAEPENFSAAAEALAILAGDAETAGLRLALEIVNRYETNLLNTVDQGLEMLRLVGAKNVHLHLDTFHMNIEEDDPVAALERALPHLAYFELDQNHRGLLNRGSIDFGPMLERLRAADYGGLIGVEAFSSAISGPDVAAGVAAWRSLFTSGDDVAKTGMDVIRGAGFVK